LKIDIGDFRVRPGRKVHLDRWPTRVADVYSSEDDYRRRLVGDVRLLSGLQQTLYASSTYAVLLIFQALDAAGKDGAIAHVLSGVNPEGCEVFSFKQPTPDELAHDFLWRTTCKLPARGRIGVFNRSYYEEVLVVRVHRNVLEAEGLPPACLDLPHFWRHRYRSIVEHERHLSLNGTLVVKIYLHLSKGEQKKRFLSRIDEPDKNWKFQLSDVRERKYWDEYMRAYEACLSATSTREAPWYIVPADDKPNARLITSKIVIEAIKGLGLGFPRVTGARRRELRAIERHLRR
jgi:PPK2 family polyphosphate:nucleotide phosphotransferase